MQSDHTGIAPLVCCMWARMRCVLDFALCLAGLSLPRSGSEHGSFGLLLTPMRGNPGGRSRRTIANGDRSAVAMCRYIGLDQSSSVMTCFRLSLDVAVRQVRRERVAKHHAVDYSVVGPRLCSSRAVAEQS